MDLIGKDVVHKTFGEGKIIQQDKNFISVSFGKDIKKFQYPSAFSSFLKIKDNSVSEEITVLLRATEEAKIKLMKLEQEAILFKKKAEQAINENQTIKKQSSKKANPRSNIAFKCNYCDGGRSEKQIGYDGICSDYIIYNNIIVENRTWCSSSDSKCLQYYNGEITRNELDNYCSGDGFVCYESQMLRDWKALAGLHVQGDNKGKARAMRNVQANSLCVLTTRDPLNAEDLRYIFAVFLIDETYEGNGRDEGYVCTESEYKIKLALSEAKSLRFWNYYKNEKNPDLKRWGQGLYRYINDEQAAHILRDVAQVKSNTQDKQLAERFYNHFCKINGIDESLLKGI